MTGLDYTAFPVDVKIRVLTHFRDEVGQLWHVRQRLIPADCRCVESACAD